MIFIKRFSGISLILLLVFTALLFCATWNKQAKSADQIVIAEFEWGGKHQITFEEMMREINELPEHKQRQYENKEQLESYMRLMAESRLILCLARDRKLNEDPEILQKVRDHFSGFPDTSEYREEREDYTHQLQDLAVLRVLDVGAPIFHLGTVMNYKSVSQSTPWAIQRDIWKVHLLRES